MFSDTSVLSHFGTAKATYPWGKSGRRFLFGPTPGSDAVISRYCRPLSSYIDGIPRLAAPRAADQISLPVAASYTWSLSSPPATNTSPVAVGITPNLKSPAVPVPVTPALARRGSSPSGTCHFIVPLFRSYEVSVVNGGLTMFE